jgi:hypothetical protein
MIRNAPAASLILISRTPRNPESDRLHQLPVVRVQSVLHRAKLDAGPVSGTVRKIANGIPAGG